MLKRQKTESAQTEYPAVSPKLWRVPGLPVIACVALGWCASAAGQIGPNSSAPKNLGPDTIVATVGDVQIRLGEVDAAAGKEAADLELRLYTVRRRVLDDMIDKLLLRRRAAEQSGTEADVIDRATAPVPVPSPITVQRAWVDSYDALHLMGDVRGRFRMLLDMQDHDRSEALDRLLANMRQAAGVEVLLPKPAYTLHVRESRLRLGVDNPTLRLTIFTDYECPYCRALETKLKASLSDPALAPKLGVVVKQFPLPIHKTAFDAAVAAVCAAGQGAFGEAHERLFTSTEHTRAGILTGMEGARIDQAAFKNCLDSAAANEEVLRDVLEAKANGVEGTPSLFLNGQRFDPGDDLVGALRAKTASPGPNAHESSSSEYKGK